MLIILAFMNKFDIFNLLATSVYRWHVSAFKHFCIMLTFLAYYQGVHHVDMFNLLTTSV
jgi:hypothetical protein